MPTCFPRSGIILSTGHHLLDGLCFLDWTPGSDEALSTAPLNYTHGKMALSLVSTSTTVPAFIFIPFFELLSLLIFSDNGFAFLFLVSRVFCFYVRAFSLPFSFTH